MPSSEEVMLEQIFVNDELAFLKKERELFRDYEGELMSSENSIKISRYQSNLEKFWS